MSATLGDSEASPVSGRIIKAVGYCPLTSKKVSQSTGLPAMLPSVLPGVSTRNSGASAPGMVFHASAHFALSNGSLPGKMSTIGRCVFHALMTTVSNEDCEGSAGFVTGGASLGIACEVPDVDVEVA